MIDVDAIMRTFTTGNCHGRQEPNVQDVQEESDKWTSINGSTLEDSNCSRYLNYVTTDFKGFSELNWDGLFEPDLLFGILRDV